MTPAFALCESHFGYLKKNGKIEDLKEVHSHYMAIDQTRKFFEKYPHIKLVESPDTALSFREIKETQR